MEELATWTQIVGTLSGQRAGCEQTGRVTRKQRALRGAGQRRPEAASIVALERADDYALLISWSDATRGRYAYQRWVIGTSRCKGQCVLSGCVIRRGDSVYRPQWRGECCPANGADMILAAVLQDLPIEAEEV
jgi:hypothetical protein